MSHWPPDPQGKVACLKSARGLVAVQNLAELWTRSKPPQQNVRVGSLWSDLKPFAAAAAVPAESTSAIPAVAKTRKRA